MLRGLKRVCFIWSILFTAFLSSVSCQCAVEPLNNGHIGDEHFVHCSEVVPSSEVEMYGQYIGRG